MSKLSLLRSHRTLYRFVKSSRAQRLAPVAVRTFADDTTCDKPIVNENCYDRRCRKEDNFWKGRLEMPDMNYLQPKTPQFDPKMMLHKENPKVAVNLDIYKERNCRIKKKCIDDENAFKNLKKNCPELPKNTCN